MSYRLKRWMYFSLLTLALLLVLYLFGFQKSSTPTIEWKSFKIKTSYFLGAIALYGIALYMLYKK